SGGFFADQPQRQSRVFRATRSPTRGLGYGEETGKGEIRMTLASTKDFSDHYYTWNGTAIRENDYKVRVRFRDGTEMDALLDPEMVDHIGIEYTDLFLKVNLHGTDLKIYLTDDQLDMIVDLDFEY